MNLFYVKPEDVKGDRVVLRDQELKHAVKVMRLQVGDEISVTDGKGTLYRCKLQSLSKQTADLKILETKNEEPEAPELTLCLGIIKKRDRLEFAVEKAVELGVNRIVVFRGDHSEKQKVRIDRLENSILSAMKQSLRYYRPEVIVENSLFSALKNADPASAIVLADQQTSDQNISVGKSKYLLVVGPEGGFSSDEIDTLKSFGAISYSLGSKRLRTETAGIIITEHFRNLK